jgi:hypothetical protein
MYFDPNPIDNINLQTPSINPGRRIIYSWSFSPQCDAVDLYTVAFYSLDGKKFLLPCKIVESTGAVFVNIYGNKPALRMYVSDIVLKYKNRITMTNTMTLDR